MERDLELKNHLEHFVPNPYQSDAWYNATTMEGKAVKVKVTQGVGRSKGKSYLHVAMSQKVSLKSPTGEVLSTWREWYLFRAERYSEKPFVEYGQAKSINGELP
jgi:hypothetical protein